ncbi:hypothetical protein D5282_23665 [bacterium 1xD8-48]|nr:hypothetical protein [bacterium 1xD8-48]
MIFCVCRYQGNVRLKIFLAVRFISLRELSFRTGYSLCGHAAIAAFSTLQRLNMLNKSDCTIETGAGKRMLLEFMHLL